MIKFAIVGIGNMGSVHAGKLYDGAVKGATLAALCDADMEKLNAAKEIYGDDISYFDDYHKMIKEKVADVLLIATPHYLHPVIAAEAFENGWNVLTEKPAGVDTASVETMNEAAKKSGKAFGIMFNQRTDPLYQALRYYISIGMIGEIKRFVWIISNWYRTQGYYDSAGWRATWKGEGGGVLINQCPHNLDLWQWMIGMPTRIHAHCIKGHFHDIAVEDDATIYAMYPNGATGVFITSTGEYPGTNRIEISGTMGKAVAEDGKLKLFLLHRDEELLRQEKYGFVTDEKISKIELNFGTDNNGHIKILQNFTDHLLTGKELIAPGYDGINSLTISNAAYLSTWLNKEIELPFDKELFVKELSKQKDKVKNAGEAEHKLSTDTEYSGRWQVHW